MARKKTAEPPKPEPPAANRQRNIFALRGTDGWKAWLDGLAERKGMPVTVLVEHALRELAKREGYADPPARVPKD